MSTAAIIPARMGSSRLPGKVLAPIGDRPMIAWVHDAATRASRIDAAYVATGCPEVVAACEAWAIPVISTARALPSGTDRVAAAARQISAEIVLNVQGDEPALTPEVLDALVAAFDAPSVQMASLMCGLPDAAAWRDPHAVKVVCDAAGDALYFSRAPIPHARRGGVPEAARLHCGVYGFRRARLFEFAASPPAPLEGVEGLEQLRALHHGWSIRMVEVDWPGLGVDTPADLARARARLAPRRPASSSA